MKIKRRLGGVLMKERKELSKKKQLEDEQWSMRDECGVKVVSRYGM